MARVTLTESEVAARAAPFPRGRVQWQLLAAMGRGHDHFSVAYSDVRLSFVGFADLMDALGPGWSWTSGPVPGSATLRFSGTTVEREAAMARIAGEAQ